MPGIGRYTASAIASIAFNEPVAVVDGNVERVLQRMAGERLAGEKLWEDANHLLDTKRPGDFNQAVMELGAVVCTPRAPSCLTCPVVDLCATRGELAAMAKAAPQKKREIHYALHCRNGNGRGREVFLIQRSPNASLMAGMWELPGMVAIKGSSQPAFALRHSITVTDYAVKVWKTEDTLAYAGKWIPANKLSFVALTGLARKILRKAEVL